LTPVLAKTRRIERKRGTGRRRRDERQPNTQGRKNTPKVHLGKAYRKKGKSLASKLDPGAKTPLSRALSSMAEQISGKGKLISKANRGDGPDNLPRRHLDTKRRQGLSFTRTGTAYT